MQILAGGGIASMAGCTSGLNPLSSDAGPGSGESSTSQPSPTVEPRKPPSGDPDTQVTLTAAEGTIRPAANVATETWVYDDSFPGPEIRVREGDIVAVDVANELEASTTTHWHGLPVANPMDGVPNVTQSPIGPGDTFRYTFRADPAGTYFYHSHAGLQLDRGLLGPLVIEESDPHVEYDREFVAIFDDYLPSDPIPGSEAMNGPSGGGGMGSGMDGGMGSGLASRDVVNGLLQMGGMMEFYRPPYAGMILNGKLATDPPTFDVAEGDRVRFRFVNASSATMFDVRLGGHRFEISHADGRPVEPTGADSFVFGPGERYDAIVDADSPGRWELRATPVRGNEQPARGIFDYESGSSDKSVQPAGASGTRLQYGDLDAVEPLEGLKGTPDRTFDLTLSPGGDGYSWAIDGQVYPNAEPLRVREGEHVRLRLSNRSPVEHPMHLHGHFFQVGDAVKDTVIVPGHMGQRTLDFVADNPGNWFFHCHNLYHLEAGMARVITYV